MGRAPDPAVVVDLAAGRLTIDARAVELRPKTWEVLRHLVERPGQLLGKAELLDLVWADAVVTEGTLNKSIGELRAALGDGERPARWIETVSRRGFRWIGPARVLGATVAATAPESPAMSPAAVPVEAPPPASASIVARGPELEALDGALAAARAGQRRVVFVTGEAGAGKTTLVDAFLERLSRSAADRAPWIAHGQCLETFGRPEPYLPLFEAFERLGRLGPHAAEAAEILRRRAPGWVAQMPALAAPGAGDATMQQPGSMLRELVAAAGELASRRPLVLVLEDAHWADFATTDAFSALARQREAAGMVLLVTMRRAEALVAEHPFSTMSRELAVRGGALALDLEPFDHESLSGYLALRRPGTPSSPRLAEWLLGQTAGNPLFVRLIVDDWLARGWPEDSGDDLDDDRAWKAADADRGPDVPESVRSLLDHQLSRLVDEEREVLEAAAVYGGEFDASTVAALTGRDLEAVEDLLASVLRRGQFLRDAAGQGPRRGTEGPRRSQAGERYAFLHATVHRAIDEGIPASRYRRLHRRAAECREAGLGEGSATATSQLAFHHEAAGDLDKAVPCLRQAARLAMRRDSPRDAIAILEHALALLERMPPSPEADREKAMTLSALGHAHQLVYGFVADSVEDIWTRTHRAAAAVDDACQQAAADSGRIMVACVGARYAEGEERIRAALPLLDRVDDSQRQALLFSAATVRWRIGAIDDSAGMFESALALKDAANPLSGADMVSVLMSQYAPVLVLQGRVDEARRLGRESLPRARGHSHYGECVAAALVSWAHALLGDFEAMEPVAARTLELAKEHSYLTWASRPECLLGILDIRRGRVEEGEARVRAGLEARTSDRHLVDNSFLLCLHAEALLDAGAPGAGEILEQARAFIEGSGERYAVGEFWRLMARHALAQGAAVSEATAHLERGFEEAQLHGNRWHAMLAAADLARLRGEGRGARAAKSALAAALSGITGGDDLERVRSARARLAG